MRTGDTTTELWRFAWTSLFVALFLLSGTSRARAQEDVVAAAQAFEQGQRAELVGNTVRAAELYELADHIVPAPEALRNAARMRLLAGQKAAAATRAEELLARYGADPISQELARSILHRVQPDLGRIRVECSAPCTLVVDDHAEGTAGRPIHILYLDPGEHLLVARFDRGTSDTRSLSAKAGEGVVLQIEAPVPSAAQVASAEHEPERAGQRFASGPRADTSLARGLKPLYLYIVASATVAVGAATIWSGVDLLNARDRFRDADTPSRAAFRDGEKKDIRTSVLIGATSGLAVGTAVLAAFTNFHRDTRAQLSADRTGVVLTARRNF